MRVIGLFLILFCLSFSFSSYSKELSSEDRLQLLCEVLSDDFNSRIEDLEEESYETCLDYGEVVVRSTLKDEDSVVVEKVKLKSGAFFNKLVENINIRFYATLAKSITYDAKGKRTENFRVVSSEMFLDDNRTPAQKLESLLKFRSDFHNGQYLLSTYDPNKLTIAGLEEEADSIRSDDMMADAFVAKGDYEFYFELGDNEELADTLNSFVLENKIFATLVSKPSERCDDSEYCSWENYTIYFKDGTSLTLDFDFGT